MFTTPEFPKVSIIMPTYNRAKYIVETIKSIRNQTWQNWELIIMDDGSDDNTELLITQFNDGRIRFFKTGRTGMVSKIKNKGIMEARGELVAFNDSDDLWAPAKLEKQVNALKQYPEAGFCLTGGYNFRNKNEPIEYFYKQSSGVRMDNVFIPLFRSEIAGFTQTLMVRKQCVEVAGFFDEEKPFSDPDFIINLASHFKAIVLFEPLIYRRLHDDNDSKEWEKGMEEGIRLVNAYRHKLPPKIVKDALFRLYIDSGEKYLSVKQRGKAISQFLKAAKKKPFSIISFKKILKAILYSGRK